MPGSETLLTFLIALFFLEVAPGPDMMLILGTRHRAGAKSRADDGRRHLFMSGGASASPVSRA
jgi:threonine/homoserine/homoserine lactone efflux protein